MSINGSTGLTRRGLLRAFAATAITAAPTYSNAFGFLKGSGDIRRLQMYSGRTGETMDTIYWIDGEYIPEAVAEVSKFMRDWRNDKIINIDTRALDIWAAAHRLMDADAPYMMLSGYRSPETNAMLRSRSRGVARNSLHMKGQAAPSRRWRAPLPPATLAASANTPARISSTWIAARSASGAAEPGDPGTMGR